MLCTKALLLIIKKIASIDFPAYRSLYFVDISLDSDLKIPFK
jgi:hypothetical protein